MMMDLDLRRRFFAEEIEAVCKLRSARLVQAFAAVPRERFVGDGPWTVVADGDFAVPMLTRGATRTRPTPDADPQRIYHNVGVAIDPSRQLFNGQPGTLAVWIDALDLVPGSRVLHVGAGTGYYTAIMAHCVGATGRVVAFEVDAELAARARNNLGSMPWVEARLGDASQPPETDQGAQVRVRACEGAERGEGPPRATEPGCGAEPHVKFDAIVINAGVTHPLAWWLDALADHGRLVLPLTVTMTATIGKGIVLLVTRNTRDSFDARVVSVVAIYSALGLRDDEMNAKLGKAMRGSPMQWQSIKRIRRDAHEPEPACWLHGDGFCISA